MNCEIVYIVDDPVTRDLGLSVITRVDRDMDAQCEPEDMKIGKQQHQGENMNIYPKAQHSEETCTEELSDSLSETIEVLYPQPDVMKTTDNLEPYYVDDSMQIELCEEITIDGFQGQNLDIGNATHDYYLQSSDDENTMLNVSFDREDPELLTDHLGLNKIFMHQPPPGAACENKSPGMFTYFVTILITSHQYKVGKWFKTAVVIIYVFREKI